MQMEPTPSAFVESLGLVTELMPDMPDLLGRQRRVHGE